MSAGRHRRPSRMTPVLASGAAAAGAITFMAAPAASAAVVPDPSVPLSPVPHAAAVTVAADISARVTVKPGDSLSKIAGALCGTSRDWTGIFAANRKKIHDPDLIYPGEVLKLDCRVTRVPVIHAVVAPVAPAAAPSSYRRAGAAVVSTAGMGGFQSCVIARESGGRTQVMNSSGHYGLYQFSASTWAGHGGNPADFGHASAAEQTQVFWNTVHADGTSDWSPYDGC